MAKKRKFFLIGAVCAAILIAVVFVVAIFATKQHDFSSNVVVSYDSTGVDGSAAASVILGGSKQSMTTDGTQQGETLLIFSKDNPTLNLTLQPTADIMLSMENSFVVFEYKFSCSSSINGFSAVLEYYGIAENVVVTTATSLTRITDYSTISNSVSNPASFSLTCAVPQTSNYYAYVKIAIKDTATNANFSANFSWTLKGQN